MKKTMLFMAGFAVLAAACLSFTVAPVSADHFLALVPSGDVGMAMATLAANKLRDYQMGDKEEYPVVAADIIFQGAAVGENGSGYSRPLVAGDPFQGFAEAKVDNSAGAAGALTVTVKKKGNIVLPVTGVSAITANDRPAVYASDDDTFTLTSTSNSLIGYVSRWISGSECVVEFDAALVKGALQA